MQKEKMHPSGISQARWDWPFKTPEERQRVAAWFKKQQRLQTQQRKEEIHKLDEALL